MAGGRDPERGSASAGDGQVGRRRLLTGGAALSGVVVAGLIGADSAAAADLRLDATNEIARSTRLHGSITTAGAFVVLNGVNPGIVRPDAILGRTVFADFNAAGVAGASEAANGGIGVLGTTAAADGTGVFGVAGDAVPNDPPPGGTGVHGSGAVNGLSGRTAGGAGVRGESATGAGVLGVGGASGLAGRFLGRTLVEGAFEATAAAKLGGLEVSGGAAVAGTLASGAATVGGRLDVGGAASVRERLDVAGQTAVGGLTVTGDATVARVTVTGPATFSGPVALGTASVGATTTDRLSLPKTSGVLTLKRAASSVVQARLALSRGSLVVATLQQHRRGLWVVAAVPSPTGHKVTIHFNRRAPRGTKVAWVVVN